MRLNKEQRHLLVDAVRRKVKKVYVAKVFGVSPKTVWSWTKQVLEKGRKRLTDRKRGSPEPKITRDIELAILEMRFKFGWGTAKLQQGIWNLPDYAKAELDTYVQGVKLSRTSINNILKRHRVNGYKRKEQKSWKRFRASRPNELWQIDLKGPFYLFGKKYWFVVCIDDYSRYVLLSEKFEKNPGVDDITNLLEPIVRKHNPETILSDNAKHFQKRWKRWCKIHQIRPLLSHPYHPQDKGKVERYIRTLGEEFINLLHKFPHWIERLQDYIWWHNHQRFHLGINTQPAKLYIT